MFREALLQCFSFRSKRLTILPVLLAHCCILPSKYASVSFPSHVFKNLSECLSSVGSVWSPMTCHSWDAQLKTGAQFPLFTVCSGQRIGFGDRTHSPSELWKTEVHLKIMILQRHKKRKFAEFKHLYVTVSIVLCIR